MTEIRLKPFPKRGKYFSYHNGFDWVKVTNEREYKRQLKIHSEFLNKLQERKLRLLLEAILQRNIENMYILVEELRKVQFINSMQTVNNQYILNNILIPRLD